MIDNFFMRQRTTVGRVVETNLLSATGKFFCSEKGIPPSLERVVAKFDFP